MPPPKNLELQLGVETELYFEVGDNSADCVRLELQSGYGEILGAEVIPKKTYTFPASSTVSMFTWRGCHVKLSGNINHHDLSKDTLVMLHVNCHATLEDMRLEAEHGKSMGPVSMVVGPTDVGKSAFCKFLLNYAARLGRRPVYVDLDVGQNFLSIPGTICVLPVDGQSDITEGYNTNSLSVYPFGYKSPGHNIVLYFLLIKRLGQMIKARMRNANPNTQASGIVIDTCGWVRGLGYSALTLAAHAFEIDVLFVLEEERLYLEMRKDMPSSVEVVYLPKQYRVKDRTRPSRSKAREDRIWEYFYGPEGNLIPHEIQVNFKDVEIYTVDAVDANTVSHIDAHSVSLSDLNIQRVNFSSQLEGSILGLSYADSVDENVMMTNVIGFVCVKRVDINQEVMTVLSPQPGNLPSKILIKGDMKMNVFN